MFAQLTTEFGPITSQSFQYSACPYINSIGGDCGRHVLCVKFDGPACSEQDEPIENIVSNTVEVKRSQGFGKFDTGQSRQDNIGKVDVRPGLGDNGRAWNCDQGCVTLIYLNLKWPELNLFD